MLLTGLSFRAQVLHTQWKTSIKKISACEYDLIFTVDIDKGWHFYSVNKVPGADLEVFPTEIVFKGDKNFTLVGGVTESKPKPEFDKTINKTVYLHYNKAVFTQRVKLKTPGKLIISGTYKYQICTEGSCNFPPKEDFSFNLTSAATCKS